MMFEGVGLMEFAKLLSFMAVDYPQCIIHVIKQFSFHPMILFISNQ